MCADLYPANLLLSTYSESLDGTVTVETNSFKKAESLAQRCVCVGFLLNIDQILELLCLKGHVRARLDAETTPVDKKRVNSCVLKHPLF